MALAAAMSLWPRSASELTRSLAVRSQIILSGNIRDVFLLKSAEGEALVPLVECVWRAVTTHGYEAIVHYDPVDGVTVYPPDATSRPKLLEFLELKQRRPTTSNPVSLNRLPDLLRRVSLSKDRRLAFIVDYASRSRAARSTSNRMNTRSLSHVKSCLTWQRPPNHGTTTPTICLTSSSGWLIAITTCHRGSSQLTSWETVPILFLAGLSRHGKRR